MNDTLKVFPIAEDENGGFKFTSPTYDDYAFVNDTTTLVVGAQHFPHVLHSLDFECHSTQESR